MGYSPNNPLVPGDPYSYDLKWIVQQLKSLKNITSGIDDIPGYVEAAKYYAEEAASAAGSMLNIDFFTTPELYGAVGDGVTDDTASIQAAFNSGKPVIIFKENTTYKVSKADDLVTFPDNDEPCVYLANRSNVSIIGNGATLKVDNYGQGIMEIYNCSNIIVDGLKFSGYGSFPAISADGRGEKGDPSGGYYNASFNYGSHKNNSVNTSSLLGVDGDATQPWGTFGDGYIGNCAIGLLIEAGSENIYVNNCTAAGFNYAGFSVGFKGHSAYSINKNIYFEKCIVNNIYDCGIDTMLCDGVTIEKCLVENIGHPSARLNNVSTPYAYSIADPGYGIVCRKPFDTYGTAKNVNVISNTINNCVRKGIDSHGCYGWKVHDNNIYLCYVGGIVAAGGNSLETYTYNALITNNKLEYCGLGGEGITFTAGTDGVLNPIDYDTNVIIKGNILNYCATNQVGLIYVRIAASAIIADNIISQVWPLYSDTVHNVILCGNSGLKSDNISINNNIINIDHEFAYIIYLNNIINGNLTGNVAHVTTVNAVVNIIGALESNVNIINNRFIADSASYAPNITTSGKTLDNIMTGSDYQGLTFIRNTYEINGGYFEISNAMFRSNSRVFIQKLYNSASPALDLTYTVALSAGSCIVYVRDSSGAAPANGTKFLCVLMCFNEY